MTDSSTSIRTSFASLHWLTEKATATFPHELTGAVNRFIVAAYLAGADARMVTTKTIAQVIQRYSDTLNRWVHDTLNRRMSEVDLRRAHKALLRGDISEEVYKEGMREAGSSNPDDDFDAEDALAVRGWSDNQADYVDGFAKDVWAASGVGADENARDAILARVDTWVDSLRSLGDAGKASILTNIPVTWKLGETEEHCKTCAQLHGNRHRMKWFTGRDYVPRKNGAAMDCKGFKCLCSLVNDKGDQVLP